MQVEDSLIARIALNICQAYPLLFACPEAKASQYKNRTQDIDQEVLQEIICWIKNRLCTCQASNKAINKTYQGPIQKGEEETQDS